MATQLPLLCGLLLVAGLLSPPVFRIASVTPVNGSVYAARQSADRAPDQPSIAGGASLYRLYCAVCHGESARGDGPLATSMRRRPADLTEILKRNQGVYPRELVFRIIDGRQPLRGHGGPDMPAWGDAFTRSIEGSSPEAVKARIESLVAYLESIQAREAE